MQILNEELRQTLFEEVTDNKPKRQGVLKTIKGIVADCKLNRNGRIYPRKLWENVINSDYVKELLASKTLFGEMYLDEENQLQLKKKKFGLIELLDKKDIKEVYKIVRDGPDYSIF